MKFFCEYCGNRIDAEVDEKCPNCGASYKKNKSFIELEKNRVQQNELNNEYKHKIINHVLGTMKFSKVFMIIPIVFFLIVFTTIIVLALNFGNDSKEEIKGQDSIKEMQDKVESLINGDTNDQQEINVNLNEYAETKDYRVKVEKYEIEEDKYNRLQEGYESVKFYLIVENLSEKEISKEEINCIVDGVAQPIDVVNSDFGLPMFISRKLAVKGVSKFIVPKDATSYDVRYGDYVTIHIEK